MNKDYLAVKLTKATLDDMERPMSNKDDVAGLHPAAVEAAQIYFDHHSDNGGTFECGSKIAHHVHDALATLSARAEALHIENAEFYDREATALEEARGLRARVETLEAACQ